MSISLASLNRSVKTEPKIYNSFTLCLSHRFLIESICFYFYFTELAVYIRHGWEDNFLFDTIWNFILAIIATSLDLVFRYIFKLQQMKENQAKIETLELREQIIKSQYEVLHAKVNPHFLYNSLNSIAGLATLDGEKTKKMALSLSRYFKYSVNRDAHNIISVKEEIEMINTYLEIEKIRFEERLQYSVSAASDTLDLKIFSSGSKVDYRKYGYDIGNSPLF